MLFLILVPLVLIIFGKVNSKKLLFDESRKLNKIKRMKLKNIQQQMSGLTQKLKTKSSEIQYLKDSF